MGGQPPDEYRSNSRKQKIKHILERNHTAQSAKDMYKEWFHRMVKTKTLVIKALTNLFLENVAK